MQDRWQDKWAVLHKLTDKDLFPVKLLFWGKRQSYKHSSCDCRRNHHSRKGAWRPGEDSHGLSDCPYGLSIIPGSGCLVPGFNLYYRLKVELITDNHWAQLHTSTQLCRRDTSAVCRVVLVMCDDKGQAGTKVVTLMEWELVNQPKHWSEGPSCSWQIDLHFDSEWIMKNGDHLLSATCIEPMQRNADSICSVICSEWGLRRRSNIVDFWRNIWPVYLSWRKDLSHSHFIRFRAR